MNQKAIAPVDAIMSDERLWQVVSSGDLKGLTPQQKAAYYLYRCKQEGLNPASQPFQFMNLQGKDILYATRSAADQLRKLHNISIDSVVCVEDDDYITYEVKVSDINGRTDMEVGSVFVGQAKGVERSNARMKALTKAKRRATYSICGTGALDETEVGDVPSPYVRTGLIDEETGEILGEPTPIKVNGKKMTAGQGQRIAALLGETGIRGEEKDKFLANYAGTSDWKKMTEVGAAAVIVALEHIMAEQTQGTDVVEWEEQGNTMTEEDWDIIDATVTT